MPGRCGAAREGGALPHEHRESRERHRSAARSGPRRVTRCCRARSRRGTPRAVVALAAPSARSIPNFPLHGNPYGQTPPAALGAHAQSFSRRCRKPS